MVKKNSYLLLPSLLSADLMHLGQEVDSLIDADIDLLHLDVMDQHYVPNLTFGPSLCTALSRYCPNTPIDVHLMVTPVDECIQRFAAAGAARITIHPEATYHVDRSLDLIKTLGCQAGIALNPATNPDILTYCMHRIDFVLVMTVNPGFGGQPFIPEILEKILWIHHTYPQLPICVDGGVTVQQLPTLLQAGATQFITGAALFNTPIPYEQTLQDMRDMFVLFHNSMNPSY